MWDDGGGLARLASSGALLLAFAACGARSGVLLEHSGSLGEGGASVLASGGTSSRGGRSGAAGGGAGSSGSPSASGGAGGELGVPLAGSYNLTLLDVSGSQIPGRSPSEGYSMRIDFGSSRAGEDGPSVFTVLATPRWGDPVALGASQTPGTLELTGVVPISSFTPPFEQDTWLDFKLKTVDNCVAGNCSAFDARLILGRNVVATGSGTVPEDTTATLRASGDIEVDTLAPEVRSEAISANGPADALLPWDPIAVRVAEPVSESALAGALSFALPSQAVPVGFGFEPSGNPATDWAGVVLASGRTTSWAGLVAGAKATLSIAPATTVTDLAKNPMAQDFSAPVQFLDLGADYSEITFLTSTDVGSWGGARWWGATMSGPCTFCMQLGPADLAYCGVPRLGIAGLLDVFVQAPTFRVYYKVLAATNAPVTSDGVLGVEVALPGSEPVVTRVNAPPLTPLTGLELGEVGGMFYGSGDLAVDIPLPTGLHIPGQIGFALFLPGHGNCPGGPGLMPVSTTVLVDHVGASN